LRVQTPAEGEAVHDAQSVEERMAAVINLLQHNVMHHVVSCCNVVEHDVTHRGTTRCNMPQSRPAATHTRTRVHACARVALQAVARRKARLANK
jgi:hypothetical protein